MAVIQKYSAGIQFCYSNELKRSEGLKGKLVVSLVVDAAGSVVRAEVVQNTLGSPALSSCALSQIRDWRFPAIPAGTTAFQVPFVFTPPN
jgi:TonB family protein